MLTGCIQDIAFADINRDTVDVLLAAGCEVMTPREQGCCGSLHAHNGDLESARRIACRLMDLFPLEQVDAIISNAGGCGSHLRHFSGLFSEGSESRKKAELWHSKIRDVHEWLVEIGFKPPAATHPERTTYHDSCHLCHGQKVSAQPRALLQSLLDGNLVNLPEASLCCGSAGIYSITHPEEAERLGRRKVQKILSTKADCVAVANPGCHLQIQRGLEAAGSTVKVRHPVSILAEACRQSSTKAEVATP
jgi:glycolate oxidase iron-sulfur subunit